MNSYITKISIIDTSTSITDIYPDIYDIHTALMSNNIPDIISPIIFETEIFQTFATLTINSARIALESTGFVSLFKFISSNNSVIYSIQMFNNDTERLKWSDTINLSALINSRIAFGLLIGFASETKIVNINSVATFEEAEILFNSGTLLN